MTHPPDAPSSEALLRAEAPHVLAALVRRYGHFELAEEATQDALLEAHRTWGDQPPDRPRGWLIRVAQRRLVDALRSEYSRQERELRYATLDGTAADTSVDDRGDDSLDLLFLCCHPVLSPSLALPLTLRALCGLTTTEIAAAFFIPPATAGQRIARAKTRLRGIPLGDTVDERTGKATSVLTVLSVMFNEGYAATAGEALERPDLAAEALRLTRMLQAAMPSHAEAEALLALMLLHTARRPARTRQGVPVPIGEQDRSLWEQDLIHQGLRHTQDALARGPLGRFQLLAAITAVHCEAPTAAETDWRQILALHDLLAIADPSPMAELSRIVALAKVHGPRPALKQLDGFTRARPRLRTHRTAAIRGHLLSDLGDHEGAATAFLEASTQTNSVPERSYLLRMATTHTQMIER